MNVRAGATGVKKLVKIPDLRETGGKGLTGVTNANCGTLTYKRNTANAAVQVNTINAGTLGTWAGHATNAEIILVSDSLMPGMVELHLPDNAFAAGAQEVAFTLRGGTNAADVDFIIEIDPPVGQLAANGLDLVIPAAPANLASPTTLTLPQHLWFASAPIINKFDQDKTNKIFQLYDAAGTTVAFKSAEQYTDNATLASKPKLTVGP